MAVHIPVLLEESLLYLDPRRDDVILDATIDGGGHANGILKVIGEKGILIGIEQDKKILDKLKEKLWKNAILINDNFRNLDKVLSACGGLKIKKIDGAIFDLGMSSVQLEESGRGFSFQKNEPLLMTFKSEPGPGDLTAKDIVNEWTEKEIADLIYEYGEERYSRRIVRGIIKARSERTIENTLELVEIIRKNIPAAYRNNRSLNCATRTFQALRIAVNDELEALREGVEKAWSFLVKDGRLVVISFHSLEDRIVKNFFKNKAILKEGEILTKKPVIAGEEEKKLNPRSKSAKLRAIKKITCGEQVEP